MLAESRDLVDRKENVMVLNYSATELVQNCFKHSQYFHPALPRLFSIIVCKVSFMRASALLASSDKCYVKSNLSAYRKANHLRSPVNFLLKF